MWAKIFVKLFTSGRSLQIGKPVLNIQLKVQSIQHETFPESIGGV